VSKKYKAAFGLSILLLLLFFMTRTIWLDYHRNYSLSGTYVCKEMPFDFISFEIDGSNKFLYYYGNDQKLDMGSFKKEG